MCIEGVARQRAFEVEVESFRGGGLRHAFVHLNHLLGREAIFLHEHLAAAGRAVARRRGV